jgi:hypothetical protein
MSDTYTKSNEADFIFQSEAYCSCIVCGSTTRYYEYIGMGFYPYTCSEHCNALFWEGYLMEDPTITGLKEPPNGN